MTAHLLTSACVLATLLGACDDRVPLGAGGARGNSTGAAGVGGGSEGHAGGGGRGGAVSGTSGAAGTSPGGAGAGGVVSSGGGAGGGAGGSSSVTPICSSDVVHGQPCTTVESRCMTGTCDACSDEYYRLVPSSPCVCAPTGVWMCVPIPPGGGGDCFFDPPLECALAELLYVDATCKTHPPCS
jgi:hypothetical protein